jgi:hypothetical protein
MRVAIMADLNIKIPATDQVLQEEPFLIFGYGVNAFFDLMISLSYMCIAITIFLLPLFYGYSQNGTLGMKGEKLYAIGQFSLGNLGGASVICNQRRLGASSMTLACPSG